MIRFLQLSCRRLNTCIEYILFGVGFSMAMIVAAQVFYRYVLNNSLFWSEELARYLLVWISFLGATTGYYRGVHPGVDVLTTRLSKRFQRWAQLLTYGISMVFFVTVTVAGFQFAYFVRNQISPALGINKWIILSVIPISGMILFWYAFTFLFTYLSKVNNDQ